MSLQFLSEPEREKFERDGFLFLPDVLAPDEVRHFIHVVDYLEDDFRREQSLEPGATVEIRNAIARDARLLPLLDRPRALGAMAGILGWNIQITTSHVFVRTPDAQAATSFKAIDWHADGPNPAFPAVHGTTPRMYAKIGYFLTDLSSPGKGNLRVVPGSHLKAQKPTLDENGEPEGAVQVLTRPGDAVIFENRTWHAVGPNTSDEPRKNIYIGYCHRYLKAIDFHAQSQNLLAQANPIQKQLLGECSNALSCYLPTRYPQDVPLKDLMEAG